MEKRRGDDVEKVQEVGGWEGRKKGRMTSRGRIHVDVGIIVREGRKRGWEEGRVREEE